jgi:hypothetical protein
MWGYKVGGNVLRSWPKAGLVVLNLRIFAARGLIFYKIIARVTTGEVTQPRRISASCPRHTHPVCPGTRTNSDISFRRGPLLFR